MPKGYVFRDYGGPETEALIDVPELAPGAGELLVRVRAAGVNPVDWKYRAGYLKSFVTKEMPAVFGQEVAGVVAGLGEGVDGFDVGDEVFGSATSGGYAQYALVPVATAAAKPPSVSFNDASTLPVAAATAYDGVQQLELRPGATLLVTGAGGGVGVAVVQIARAQGATVIGTASPGKREFVESLGATHVAYGPGVADRVRAAAPGGVDAIYDTVGGDALRDVAETLADRSMLVSAADATLVKELGGASVRRARNAAVLEACAALVASGALDPRVTVVRPLEEAGAALALVEAGHATGKVVVEVA